MKVRFKFQAEGLWMLAFSLAPGIIITLLIVVLEATAIAMIFQIANRQSALGNRNDVHRNH
jgi:hypothetical protein